VKITKLLLSLPTDKLVLPEREIYQTYMTCQSFLLILSASSKRNYDLNMIVFFFLFFQEIPNRKVKIRTVFFPSRRFPLIVFKLIYYKPIRRCNLFRLLIMTNRIESTHQGPDSLNQSAPHK